MKKSDEQTANGQMITINRMKWMDGWMNGDNL